jgi:hypothetical protein
MLLRTDMPGDTLTGDGYVGDHAAWCYSHV